MSAIKVTSINDLTSNHGHLIIDEDIQLTADLNIASGSTLQFQNGAQIKNGQDNTHYVVNFNDNTIVAPDYPILSDFGDYEKISGTLANGEINADWFGAGIWRKTATATNKALGLSQEDSVIILPRQKYYVENKIVLSTRRRGFKCHGRLIFEVEENFNPDTLPNCLIELQAEQLQLDIGSLECNRQCDTMSAVLFSGNVYNCNIDIRRMLMFGKGLNFSPTVFSPNPSEDIYYAGSQYNKIRWQTISCSTGIYINLWASNPNALHEGGIQIAEMPIYRVWVNENYFLGGRINGLHGMVTDFTAENSFAELAGKYIADNNNGNVFENVSFEGVTGTAVSLYKTQLCRFYDLRGPVNVADNTPLILLQNCKHIDFHFKGYFNPNHLTTIDSSAIRIDAVIVDHNFNPVADGSQLEVVENCKCITRRCGNVTATTHKTFSTSDTINLVDLLEVAQSGDMVMTVGSEITLASGIVLTVETSGINRAAYPGLLINAVLGSNSQIQFSQNNYVTNSITSNGTYLISFLYGTNNLQIIQL